MPCACGPSAGDAATQRFDSYFQARPPVFSLIALRMPELVEKKRRPYPIAGGNSTRFAARNSQTGRNGGRSGRSIARVRAGVSPYIGHSMPSGGFGAGAIVGTNSTVGEPRTLPSSRRRWTT